MVQAQREILTKQQRRAAAAYSMNNSSRYNVLATSQTAGACSLYDVQTDRTKAPRLGRVTAGWGMRSPFEVLEMSYILLWVVVSWA